MRKKRKSKKLELIHVPRPTGDVSIDPRILNEIKLRMQNQALKRSLERPIKDEVSITDVYSAKKIDDFVEFQKTAQNLYLS